MSLVRLSLSLTILVIIASSCSGGGSPLLPPGADGEGGLTGTASESREGISDHALWGFWEGYFDTSTGALEARKLRQAEFHLNVGHVLDEPGNTGLALKINSFNPTLGLADVDVRITHPYPNSDMRGFDVRGIFMGPGDTMVSETDPGLIYSALNGTRLLNADGYTRWWNAVEFTTAGFFGYDSNTLVPGFLVPTTTLNPYKYFSDSLGPTDPVVPGVNPSNRGTFSTDTNPPSLTRNYLIRFPIVGGNPKLGFHYAIDASWAPPGGNNPTPKPIGDYPIQTNCPEPFHIQVNAENSTAWYGGPGNLGGDLVLDIEVFDWGAAANPEGIMGEISGIVIESPTLCSPYYLNLTTALPGTQSTSGIFHVTIPDVHPTGLDNQEILVTVKSKSPVSYAPPSGIQDYPKSAALAAYTIVSIPVLDTKPSFFSIDLVSPNGGEVWPISSEQMIKWTWTDEIPNVDIYLSTDGGANFDVPIALGIENTGQYNLGSVPNSPTEHARIRISSTAAPEVSGESDGNFVIKPTIIVDLPNGGDFLLAGTSAVIKWTASDTIQNVGILLSMDSGGSYLEPLSLSSPNTGEFDWEYICPEYVGNKCRIEVFDAAHPQVLDSSDADFTILPVPDAMITVLSPNGGEEFEVGKPAEITWGASGAIANVAIWLSTDSGQNYDIELTTSTPNDGNFTVGAIPDDAVNNACRIRVSNVDNPTVFDESDNDFMITGVGFTIQSPSAQDSWPYNSLQAVEWAWTGNPPLVDIDLSLDGGANFDIVIIHGAPNTGLFNFKVGDWVTDQAVLRVSSSTGPGAFGVSDGQFSITPSITVLSPNNSELWIEGNVYEISWDASSVIDKVIILKSSDSGQEYLKPITLSTDNDGSYMWYIEPTGDTGTHQRVQVLDALDTSIHDGSDADFTIFPEQEAPVNVLSPNGGELWIAGTSREITWTAVPSIQDVKIELSVNGGSTWPYIVVGSTPNDSSFIWGSVPSSAVGSFNRIRVSDVLNPSISDISNASFTIEEMGDPFMDILAPIDGQTWQIGWSHPVQWQWGGLISNVDISFKLDNLGTYAIMADDIANNGTYTIPTFEPSYINDLGLWDSPLLTGVVKIESSDDPTIFDEVDIVIPINLGILYQKVQVADPTDSDCDNLPDEIELFLGTDPDYEDSDLAGPDAFFDDFEIFGNGYFGSYDLIPDKDKDSLIAPLDSDDDGDGINDGQATDSDSDGIPNYLEYYGYTYDWMSGTYHQWDGHSINKPYFKTDPLQPSTDQDPYSDSMEASGAFMDVSVEKPGGFPMVPAYPDIIVRLEGYDVAINEEITLEEGNSLEQGTEWSTQTQHQTSESFQHSGEASIAAELGYASSSANVLVTIAAKYGFTYNKTTTNAVTKSVGGSAATTQEWSQATCTNPTDAAHLKIYLKVYNQGTSCASNIIPTITLKIGNRNIATFDTGTEINILEPGGVYPSQPSTYWVIDRVSSSLSDPISLTLDELRALECGAPVSIVMTQMKADVMLMNESGQWESAGDWGQYMARCEAVCSNMYLEIGGGNFLHYLVYSGDEPSAPEVTFGDALAWAAGAGASATDTWITYTDDSGQQKTASLEDWNFGFDAQTLIDNGFTGSPLEPPTPDFNINDLVLFPHTQITATIPREQTPEQIPDVKGPDIIYSYFDDLNDSVSVLTFDYSGVESVEFHDNAGGVIDMDEMISGSGLYTLQVSSSYQYDGSEFVRAYSLDATVPYTDTAVEKLVYANIPQPVAPVITNVAVYFANRMVRVSVDADPEYPLTSVKALWSCDSAEVSLVKGAPYGDNPNAWYGFLPDCVTSYNYTYVMVTASVTPEVFDKDYGVTTYQRAKSENYDDSLEVAIYYVDSPDVYRVEWRDLDSFGHAPGTEFDWWYTNDPDWQNFYSTFNLTQGNGDFIMYQSKTEGVNIHFTPGSYSGPLQVTTYNGSKEFRLITLEDCMAHEYYDTSSIDVANNCLPEITIPSTILYITPEGRFGKMQFREVISCLNSASEDNLTLGLEYVTFYTNEELYF